MPVTKWKKFPGKTDIFPHSVLFSHWAFPKICNSDPLMNFLFQILCSLKTFEKNVKICCFSVIVMAIIQRRHLIIEQLS